MIVAVKTSTPDLDARARDVHAQIEAVVDENDVPLEIRDDVLDTMLNAETGLGFRSATAVANELIIRNHYSRKSAIAQSIERTVHTVAAMLHLDPHAFPPRKKRVPIEKISVQFSVARAQALFVAADELAIELARKVADEAPTPRRQQILRMQLEAVVELVVSLGASLTQAEALNPSTRVDKAVKRTHVEAWLASGLPSQIYAERHGLSATKLRHWKWLLKRDMPAFAARARSRKAASVIS